MGWIEDTASRIQAMSSSASQAAEVVKSARDEIVEAVDEIDGSASRLDQLASDIRDTARRAIGDIESYLEQLSGPFAEEIKLQLELVKTAGINLRDFMTTFGEAVITTEDGAKTIRELLEGIDFQAFEDEIRELTELVREGGVDLDEVLGLLEDRAGTLTQRFRDAVDAFQRGEVSIERVMAALRELQEIAGETPLSDLADEIFNALRSEQL